MVALQACECFIGPIQQQDNADCRELFK